MSIAPRLPDVKAYIQIVLLQSMKEEPAADAKCKDKFLVQSVLVSPELEFANVTSIVWLPVSPLFIYLTSA